MGAVSKNGLYQYVYSKKKEYNEKLLDDLKTEEELICLGEDTSSIKQDIHYDRVIVEIINDISKICAGRGRF